MDNTAKPDFDTTWLVEAWMKSSAELWEAAARMWLDTAEKMGVKGRTFESMDGAFRTWQVMASLMGEPGAAEGLLKGAHALPSILLKMIQPAFLGIFQLQREWLERASRIGTSTSEYTFENLDRGIFEAWHEIYEKEFRRFLKIPPLGLARPYQERMNEAADKLAVFEAAVGEFLSMVCLPVEESFNVMQEKLRSMADAGKLPQRSIDYYRMWIKILEGHYMSLFKSSEYNRALARIVDAMGGFTIAREEILQDALKAFPLPTYRDMDELYREIYRLKNRVAALERKNRLLSVPESK